MIPVTNRKELTLVAIAPCCENPVMAGRLDVMDDFYEIGELVNDGCDILVMSIDSYKVRFDGCDWCNCNDD